MRLPWPFGRSESDRGASSGSGADAGGGAPGAGSPSVGAASSPADAPIRPTGAWRTLPPIQRSSGPPPVVAPAAPFLADVPGHAAAAADRHAAGPRVEPERAGRPRRRAPARRPEPHLERAAPRRGPCSGMPRAASLPRPRRRPGRPRTRRSSRARRRPRSRGPRRRRPSTAAAAPELPADPHRAGGGAVGRRDARVASADPDGAVPGPVVFGAVRRHDAVRGGRAIEAGRTSRLPIQASGRVPTSVSPSPSAAPGAGRAPLAPVRRFAELPVEAPAPPVQREATGHAAPASAPRCPRPPTPPSPSACRCARARRPAMPVTPASPAASSAAVSRLSDGTHDVHDPAPAIAAASVSPARPLPVLPVARQRPGATRRRLGHSAARRAHREPLRRARRRSAGLVRSDGLPVRRHGPAHGRRPAAAPGRDRDAGRARSARRRPPAEHPHPARRPRPRCPSPHAGTPATRCRPTVTSLPAFPRTGARSAGPALAGRLGAAVRPSMPQAANGAREIVFPPRDGGGEPPRGRRAAFLRHRRRPRSVHRRRPGPRR